MVEEVGQEKVDELFRIKNQVITKWALSDYENKRKEYQEKLLKLNSLAGLEK